MIRILYRWEGGGVELAAFYKDLVCVKMRSVAFFLTHCTVLEFTYESDVNIAYYNTLY